MLSRYLYVCLGLIFALSSTFAFPPLTPYQQGNTQIMAPQGWSVAIDEAQGIIIMDENPNDPSGASLVMLATPQQANLTPEVIIQNFLTTTVVNFQVIEQTSMDDNGGLLVVATGMVEGISAKVAALSFYDMEFGLIRLAVFAATPQSFERLGGAPLIFVTFGGQDPSQFQQASTDSNQQPTNVGGVFLCEDFLATQRSYQELTLEYNKHQCLIKNRQSVSNDVILGEWSQATGAPVSGAWENVVTGEISYDSSGYGMSLRFHQDGNYEILYLYSASNSGCTDKVEAYETGQYSLDGQNLSLTLQPNRYVADLDSCYGPPSQMNENNLPVDTLEIAFHPTLPDMALTIRCREYIISCGDDGYLRTVLVHK